jgi:hypothetical protein
MRASARVATGAGGTGGFRSSTRGSLSEEYSAGQEVADRIHSNTKLRLTVHEATLRPSGLLSFRLLDDDLSLRRATDQLAAWQGMPRLPSPSSCDGAKRARIELITEVAIGSG